MIGEVPIVRGALMYIAIVALTMLILPVVSIAIDYDLHPSSSAVVLVGRWFVFWGVGVRIALAGMRQFFQPSFTARDIFHTTSDEVLPIVRELGVANFSAAVVALLSLAMPSFVLPAAISAAIFYGIAGIRHFAERDRSPNENIALGSDLFMASLLALFVVANWP
jgi:hypothetical protein